MHFEHLVLAHLEAAGSVDAWQATLRSAVQSVAGDDATMALLAVGGDLDATRTTFRHRLEHLEKTYIQPLDEIEQQTRSTVQRADELRRQRLELRAELWSRYKPDYERLLPEPGTAGGEQTVDPAPTTEAADPPDPPQPERAGVDRSLAGPENTGNETIETRTP
jgi:hypothetical protein